MDLIEILLKLILAIALGGLIGLEREASQKPAGFRTNILVCVGSAMMMSLAVGSSGANGPSVTAGWGGGLIRLEVAEELNFLGTMSANGPNNLITYEYVWGRIWEPRFDPRALAEVRKSCLPKCSSTCYHTIASYYDLNTIPQWLLKHARLG